MQKSVIDAVAPDAPIIQGGGACHAGHRCRAASRVEAHRSQMTGQTHTRMRATPACGSARWCGAHTRVGLACHLTAVGLDAGRGTTPVTGVASASTLNDRGVWRHRVDHGLLHHLVRTEPASVMQRPSPRQPAKSRRTGTAYGNQLGGSNRLVTEPSSKTSRIAWLSSGAIDSSVSLSK